MSIYEKSYNNCAIQNKHLSQFVNARGVCVINKLNVRLFLFVIFTSLHTRDHGIGYIPAPLSGKFLHLHTGSQILLEQKIPAIFFTQGFYVVPEFRPIYIGRVVI